MDTLPQDEKPKPAELEPRRELIQFEQKFKPFENCKHLKPDWYLGEFLLDNPELFDPKNPNLSKFVVSISTAFNKSHKNRTITPFNPEASYQITDEDFDLEKRAEKVKRYGYELVDEKIAPLDLTQDWFGPLSVLPGDFSHTYSDMKKVMQSLRPYFNRILLQVTFPGTLNLPIDDPNFRATVTFESRPDQTALNILTDPTVEFRKFYPLDTGPLANPGNPDDLNLPEGLHIQLPNDSQKLSQIEMEFILLPDPNKKNEDNEDDDKSYQDDPDYKPFTFNSNKV